MRYVIPLFCLDTESSGDERARQVFLFFLMMTDHGPALGAYEAVPNLDKIKPPIQEPDFVYARLKTVSYIGNFYIVLIILVGVLHII